MRWRKEQALPLALEEEQAQSSERCRKQEVAQSGLGLSPKKFQKFQEFRKKVRLKKAQEQLLPTVYAAAPDGQQPVQAVATTAQPAK